MCVWDNMNLKKKTKNLHAYQLYAEVLDRIQIHEGMITKYHQQTKHRSKLYLTGLTTLSYDLLYGDNYAYDGKNPFKQTELQMGTEPGEANFSSKDEKWLPGSWQRFYTILQSVL